MNALNLYMPIKNTSTDEECPIKSPISSNEHGGAFSCCFLTGWLACLFTLPNPHMLKKPVGTGSAASCCFSLNSQMRTLPSSEHEINCLSEQKISNKKRMRHGGPMRNLQ